MFGQSNSLGRRHALNFALVSPRSDSQPLSNMVGVVLDNRSTMSVVRVFGTAGGFAYTNSSYSQMFGYEAAECIGLAVADLVHPDDQLPAENQLGKLIRAEINSYRAERRYRRKNGDTFWGRVSASILREEGTGEPIYLILQVEDIDQQKLAEAAVVESESRWNFALEGAGQGVWDHDLRHGKVFYSRTWRQMRGFGVDEEIDGSRDAWLARVSPEPFARQAVVIYQPAR